MISARALVPILFGGLAVAAAGVQSPAHAGTTQPCVSNQINASGLNFAPINGGTSTYCQSAFGWSDTWFPTSQPASYDAHLDVFSGDNAPSLRYTARGGPVGTGNIFNFLSPFLDGGHLDSQNIGGGATVVTDIPAGPLAGSGASLLQVGQVQIGLLTTVHPDNSVTEQFTFTNVGTDAVTNLLFDDYFNFHPDGSNGPADQFCGATTFAGGVVTTVGKVGGGCSPVVAKGTMQGSLDPSFWDVGDVGQVDCPTPATCTTTPGGVLDAIAIAVANGNFGNFNNSAGDPTHFGDTGADLVWELGDLAAGGSTTFVVTKNFTPVPEPASAALLGAALLGFGILRRRNRKS